MVSQAALAQRAVVLEFEGDRNDRVRAQVQHALEDAGAVELISLKRYKRAALKRKLRGNRAMTPAAVPAAPEPSSLRMPVVTPARGEANLIFPGTTY